MGTHRFPWEGRIECILIVDLGQMRRQEWKGSCWEMECRESVRAQTSGIGVMGGGKKPSAMETSRNL